MRKRYIFTLALLILLSLAVGTSVADDNPIYPVGMAWASWVEDDGTVAEIAAINTEIYLEEIYEWTGIETGAAVAAYIKIPTDTGYIVYKTVDEGQPFVNIPPTDFIIYNVNAPRLITTIPVEKSVLDTNEYPVGEPITTTLKLNIVWKNAGELYTKPTVIEPDFPSIVRGMEKFSPIGISAIATGSIRGDITKKLGTAEYAYYGAMVCVLRNGPVVE